MRGALPYSALAKVTLDEVLGRAPRLNVISSGNALDFGASHIPTGPRPSNPVFLVNVVRGDPASCFEEFFRAKPAYLSLVQGSCRNYARAKNSHLKTQRPSAFST